MKTTPLLLAVLLAAMAAPALAQESPGPMFIVRGAHVASIRNAPYSAQMVTERQQNLSDGNQIASHRTTLAYRDSAGRTRQEVADAKGEVKAVTIHDPVAGATWILRPQDRTATRIARPGEEARARIEQMHKDGTLPTVERHKLEDGKEEIIIKRVVRTSGAAAQGGAQDVRIQVPRALEANGPALRELQTRLAPLAAGAVGDMKWASKAIVKDLGTREFSGVKAEGKLRSYEIPAGEIGNRNPIVVSDETWYAPDLQVTVYTKHSDPRSGDTVFRLENLKREEPAASLFAVPSDYTVKEPLAGKNAQAQ